MFKKEYKQFHYDQIILLIKFEEQTEQFVEDYRR